MICRLLDTILQYFGSVKVFSSSLLQFLLVNEKSYSLQNDLYKKYINDELRRHKKKYKLYLRNLKFLQRHARYQDTVEEVATVESIADVQCEDNLQSFERNDLVIKNDILYEKRNVTVIGGEFETVPKYLQSSKIMKSLDPSMSFTNSKLKQSLKQTERAKHIVSKDLVVDKFYDTCVSDTNFDMIDSGYETPERINWSPHTPLSKLLQLFIDKTTNYKYQHQDEKVNKSKKKMRKLLPESTDDQGLAYHDDVKNDEQIPAFIEEDAFKTYFLANMDETIAIAMILDKRGKYLSFYERFQLCKAPINLDDQQMIETFEHYISMYNSGKIPIKLNLLPEMNSIINEETDYGVDNDFDSIQLHQANIGVSTSLSYSEANSVHDTDNTLNLNENVRFKMISLSEKEAISKDLLALESCHRIIDLYIWLAWRFPDAFDDRKFAQDQAVKCSNLINLKLLNLSYTTKKKHRKQS